MSGKYKEVIQEIGLKKASDEDNNIIISGSALQNILPPQLKKIIY